jgi:hypothetical protein
MALSMAINWAFQIFRQNKATLSVSARGIPSSQPALCRLFMANLCCPAKKEKQKLWLATIRRNDFATIDFDSNVCIYIYVCDIIY